MIDQEILFEDIPFDQETEVLDLSGYSWEPGTPGVGRGKLITFVTQGENLVFGSTVGWYLEVLDSPDGVTFTGHAVSIGIGLEAMLSKGIKFTLPSNVSRYIKMRLVGDITAGTYTVYAIME